MTARPLRRRRSGRPFLIAGLALGAFALSGCALLSSAPERQLYRLDPKVAFAAPLPPVAAQLLVARPAAPAALDTRRIALSRSPVSLDYFAGAEWSDRIPFLVQSALVDGFVKSAAIAAVGPDSGGFSADFVIETEIGDFTAIYDTPEGPPRAVVSLDVRLVKMPGRRIVAHDSVRREQRAAANAVPQIAEAFDKALGGAVEEVVGWTLRNPALSGASGSVTPRTRFVHPEGKAP